MFRVIIGIIVSLFMISLLRMIMGAISREVGGGGSKTAGAGATGRRANPAPPPGPAGGELRKCPACGAYHTLTDVAAKNSSGAVLHFCSQACREKFTT